MLAPLQPPPGPAPPFLRVCAPHAYFQKPPPEDVCFEHPTHTAPLPRPPCCPRAKRWCPAEGPRLLRASPRGRGGRSQPPVRGCAGVWCGGERCCVILSTLHSGSSHETDTFCLLCFVSIGRRSGYCCRKLLLFLCSVDQLFPSQSLAEIQWVSLSPFLSLFLLLPACLSLLHAVCLAGNPRRRLITAAPSNTNSWDSSVAFADVY